MSGASHVLVVEYPPLRRTKKIFGESLYTALINGTPLGAAYRQAIVDLAGNAELSPPYHWAPFVLWGTGGDDTPR
jgi:hypothetical protein